MPWKETCAMDQRIELIGDWLKDEYSITELSRMYGVSRNTVYKWIARYNTGGLEGLEERPCVPGSHPNATAKSLVDTIVSVRFDHQRWGPKKIGRWLEDHYSDECWPAISTIGEILKREGLVRPRKNKRRTPPYTQPFNGCDRPNQTWSADYKGQFRTGDGLLCYPLTMTDNCSRYLLICRGLPQPTLEATKPWFERAFKEYGLPEAIRTDNGSPFASVAVGGLTRLSVWLVKLGVKPERIDSGHPEQNGRHERMHRTLKEETASPPRSNSVQQQMAFESFRREFNFERPHEALGQTPPASTYEPSERRYNGRVPKVEYDDDVIVRQVRHNGEIKWKGHLIYVSDALAGEPVALEQIDEHLWDIRFSFHHLGILNEITNKIQPDAKQKQGRRARCG